MQNVNLVILHDSVPDSKDWAMIDPLIVDQWILQSPQRRYKDKLPLGSRDNHPNMASIMDLEMTQVFIARYVSGGYFSSLYESLNTNRVVAVALILIVYDHFITFDDEVANVWLNHEKGRLHKITFIMNRYFSEAVVAFIAYGMWYTAKFWSFVQGLLLIHLVSSNEWHSPYEHFSKFVDSCFYRSTIS